MKSLFFLTVFFSQFLYAQQDIGQRSADIAKSRSDLEGLLDKRSYTEEDHKIIKAYFYALNAFESDLNLYSKYRKRFNGHIRSVKVSSFCSSTFLDASRWKSLVNNCTKNDYFLCTDDVMTFIDTKKKLSEKLDADLKTEFEKTDKCK